MTHSIEMESRRQKILSVAAEEIHLHGFQTCNLSNIIRKSGVSKGALYHHFPNKLALGYAVLDEVFMPEVRLMWSPVLGSDDPIQALISLLEGVLSQADTASVAVGCPINNLAQEMSPLDEGFRLRINAMMQLWQKELETLLHNGQAAGSVKAEINTKRTAVFLIASIEGSYGLAKNAQDLEVFSHCIYGLIDYVEQLKGESYA